MRLDRRQMKHEARLTMRNQRPSVFLVAFILLLLLWVLEILSVKLMYPGENLMEIARRLMSMSEAQPFFQDGNMSVQDFYERYAELQELTAPSSSLGRLLDVAISIMKLMLTTGFMLFCMNAARGIAAGPGNLLDTFGYFFKILFLNILISLFTALWSMLLIFPGWIAHYRYSLAFYILLDDPDKGVLQCIHESKELTRGHKWELFVLDLSFIGWFILALIPFVRIYTMPFMELTRVNYYRNISGRLAQPDAESETADNDWDEY